MTDGDEKRWQAIVSRDAHADGTFVYAVKTTGVFCRPSCPSRRPKRANVAFFETIADARDAGFRPCKRCRPEGVSPSAAHVDAVAKACALIEASETVPNLAELAAHVGLSPHHFHRLFKKATGVTPRAYAADRRARRMREELDSGAPVTSAIYGAGYGASSRYYEEADDRFGMTASDYRNGGEGVTIRFAVAETSLGALLVAATAKGVCAIELGDDPDALVKGLQDRFPRAELIGADAAFEALIAQVVGYVEAPRGALALPLDVQGTAFQQRVWAALRKIPAGTTISYAELARTIGEPTAARAVARACATNVIAIAIPCHRVVRTDGNVSGYRWGVARKRELLAREAASS